MGHVLPRPARAGKPDRFLARFLVRFLARFLARFLPIFRHFTSETAALFRPRGLHETKRDANETISGIGEDVRKLAMVTNPANE